MSPPRIRTLALALVWRGDELLVSESHDPVKDETFYRPPGGGIEFGETGAQAVVREMREEFGVALEVIRPAGMLENVFVYAGQPRHEIVLLFEARVVDPAFYRMDRFNVVEDDGEIFVAMWRRPADIAAQGRPLYPDGLAKLLTPPVPVALG